MHVSPMRRRALLTAAAVLWFSPALAAENFTTQLLPSPMTAATRLLVTGTGHVLATLDGGTLTISGDFSGLSAPATTAYLRSGALQGVPGPDIATLTVAQAHSGSITGTAKLTRAQIEALHRKAVYVQIDSVKAPEPYGSVWGWFESAGK